jgi:hypothetical protein
MKKGIIIAALIIALLGGLYGYKQLTKGHIDVNAAAEDVNIAAADLFKAFVTDEAVANPKYLDKVIKVCGVVAENSATNEGSTTIQLETGDEMGGVVMCELDDLTKQATTAFNKGDKVCFKGLCSGFTADVVLNRCVLSK